METEIWKKIEGYENYEVSNEGRVRSLNYHRSGEMKVLRLEKTKNGYLQVSLYKDEKPKRFKVHRLVATAFLTNSDNLPYINHKNEDKTDNRVENLEWCTIKYNNSYGTRIQKVSVNNTNGKKSKPVLQFTKDGKFIREWPSLSEVQRVLGYATSNISKCCKDKHKSAYNFVWKYK